MRGRRPRLAPRRGRPGQALGSALAGLCLGALASTCARDAAEFTPALRELERLAFVPAGSVSDPSGAFRDTLAGAREALLVDMCEVTREQWLRFQEGRAASVDPLLASFTATWDPTTRDWPASFVTQTEARQFAASRGMRLLTAGEWLYCAVGRERRPFPWGHYAQASIANTLELGLERPAPVGTFEAGRTPQSCYDMLGNVAEWVDDGLSGDGGLDAERAAVFGGSFRSRVRAIFTPKPGAGETELFAQTLPRASRADDIGLRCAAPAAEYLWAHASQWGAGTVARARLVQIGARWGRPALGVLEELATRPDAPASLDALAEGARQ
jgi:hypothetical protein